MSTNNKPEIVADPTSTEAVSEAEAISQRLAEGREKQKSSGIMESLAPNAEDTTDNTGGAEDVNSQKSSSDTTVNVDSAALSLVETSTGRKFANLEDAKKFLSNLNSLVGDQSLKEGRDAAKVLQNLKSKFGKTDNQELEQYLVDILANPNQTKAVAEESKSDEVKTQSKVAPKMDDETQRRLDSIEHAIQLSTLEKKYPEASEVADEVALIAKGRAYRDWETS